MHSLNDLTDLDKLVLDVIKRETILHGGVFQTKLKEFPELRGIEPQNIARSVLKLVKKGLVKRQLVNNNGRSMYFLQAVMIENKQDVSIPVRLGIVTEIPCFYCRDLERCAEGGLISPSRCPILTRYLLSKIDMREYYLRT